MSHSTYSFADNDGRTIATYVSTYETVEGLQKVLDMGMAEGATQSLNQIDQFLAG
ncbi:activator of Hsp90 ATPase 1 family protein [Mycobacteroides abscessus subsp. abscessus]|nr:activator of Hsp90 ATPase 1 family protein [Mycobacteroides abscessus subsp. abscessus]